MGKLKQPIPLLKMSTDVLCELLLERCIFIAAADGSVKDVRRLIVVFRDKICRHMPWYLLANFCHIFLDKFYSAPRLLFCREAALEIIMDIEIHGLRFEGPMTAYLAPCDAHRIRELTALDMVPGSWLLNHDTTVILELFHLTELTLFKQCDCTNTQLEIIARKCPKLEILCLPGSNRVTDIGLRNLNRCSSLRYVDISECKVSHKGVNDLLSSNSTIDTLVCSDMHSGYKISNVSLLLLEPSIYPSMKSLVIKSAVAFTSAQLNCIVTKFPNLTSIRIYSVLTGDLNALKSLDNLTVIELNYSHYDETVFPHLVTWNDMEPLLRVIGTNITTLRLGIYERSFYFCQVHMNFMFNYCPNIEHLEFLLASNVRLVVPSFQKLKELKCHQTSIPGETAPAVVEFDTMPSLAALCFTGMQDLNANQLVFDHKKFPNLTVLKFTITPHDDDVLAEVRKMIKINNLDFEIKDYWGADTPIYR